VSKIKVLAFAGKKQSGKNTSINYISPKLTHYSDHVSFAGPLKTICGDLFELDNNQLYGTDAEKNTLTKCVDPDTNDAMTARQVMQIFGTDMCRSIKGDVWVSKTMRTIDKCLYNPADFCGPPDYIFIDDCRFTNEYDALKAREDTLVIKVERPGYSRNDAHVSETALDHLEDADYDHVLRAENLEELYSECDKLIERLRC